MNIRPPTDSTFAVLSDPEVCAKCQSVSRLTNGLCLNCLLHDALEEDESPSGKEAFKEMLAGVKSRDGDWHIADHEILHQVARGGMGVVYQAREPHSGRIVALKCVITEKGDSDHLVARFRREAETAARLEHPNIVPIYRVGETPQGSPFYTMKYATGGSLLQARGPLLQHPRQSAALMVKVARAVHYAHEKGVLHRDLKPGNILLDSHGEPLVSDFGLARCETVSGYLTRSLASFGTPGYIAPEQADGPAAQLMPAADVYSLGAILFELLTGRTPFVGDNAFAVMKQSAEERAPKVRSLAPHLDRDLEIICDRCLEREPADRYQSAGEVADDLQNWLDDRPIRARPPGPWLQTRRWVRRNRVLTVCIALLCLAVGFALLWQVRAQTVQSAMNQSILAARSVVVLPLLDLDSADVDPVATQWVADALKRELQTLGPASVTTSQVPGWAKLELFRSAARETKSRTVLTGTVRNVKGQRRISLRLIDPSAGETLFAAVVEPNKGGTESARLGDDSSREIYKILSATDWSDVLNSRKDPGLRNDAAAEKIKAGHALTYSYTLSDFDQAINLLQQAANEEPNSSLAHAYLAGAATARSHFVSDPKYLELGRTEASKALELQPDSVDAHRALAGVYYQEGKFQEALEEQMRIVEFGGVDERIPLFVAMTLDVLGRPDRALSWYQISSKRQDRPGETQIGIGDRWVELGDDERAFQAYDHAIELQPGSPRGAVGKAHLHLLRGEFDAAREIYLTSFRNLNDPGEMVQIAAQVEFFARKDQSAAELYSKLLKSDAKGGGSFYGSITYGSALGRIKQWQGANEEAAQLLTDCLATEIAAVNRQPQNPEALYRLAAVEACLNQTSAALQHLSQSIALGWLDYRSLQRDPRFDSLRTNPELDTLIDGLSAKVAELRSRCQRK